LERALILADDGPISAEHFSSGAETDRTGNRIAAEVLTEGFNLDAFERDLIYAALKRAGGNKAAAARVLGITRRRLYSRLAALTDSKDERADDS
jgi:DNA-binding NtrC family response regulator